MARNLTYVQQRDVQSLLEFAVNDVQAAFGGSLRTPRVMTDADAAQIQDACDLLRKVAGKNPLQSRIAGPGTSTTTGANPIRLSAAEEADPQLALLRKQVAAHNGSAA